MTTEQSFEALVYWTRVIGVCWIITCSVIVLLVLFKMYQIREITRFAKAGQFLGSLAGEGIKGLVGMVTGDKPAPKA